MTAIIIIGRSRRREVEERNTNEALDTTKEQRTVPPVTVRQETY